MPNLFNNWFSKIVFITIICILCTTGCNTNQIKQTEEVTKINDSDDPDNISSNELSEITNTSENEIVDNDEDVYVEESSYLNSDFYYSHLLDERKIIYNQLEEGINAQELSIEVDAVTNLDINYTLAEYLKDHPECFWIKDTGTINFEGTICNFTPLLNSKVSSINEEKEMIEESVKGFLDSIPSDADRYTKIKMAYEWIINKTEYNPSSKHGNTIKGVFIDNEAYCYGYSKAFQYLMNQLEIPCIIIEGVIFKGEEGESYHSWNMVEMDNNFYLIDCTLADLFLSNIQLADENAMNYDYFLLTDKELSRTNTYFGYYDFPICNNSEYDYYHMNDLYFESYEFSKLENKIVEKIENGENILNIKYSSEEYFKQALDAVANGDVFMNIIKKVGNDIQLAYCYNPYLYTITIEWIL